MKKISLGIVFYNPTTEQIERSIRYSEYGLFTNILVCDNSDKALDETKLPSNVRYMHMGYNSGLSVPYNKMIRLAIKSDDDFICLMDQDSIFEATEIKKIIEFIEHPTEDIDNIAVICPFIETEFAKCNRDTEKEYVGWTINSGSFLNLKVIRNESVSYDENVFLDGVDYDFCWNVTKKKKKKILRLNNAKLFQSFGYIKDESRFTHHGASRYYNITHNRKYIFKKYYGNCGFIAAILVNMRLAFRILLHEDNKTEKVKACIKGTID